jgi:hypothetical protein
MVQQVDILGREQRKQMIEGKCKVVENELAISVGADFIKLSQVHYEDVLAGKRLRASLRKAAS